MKIPNDNENWKNDAEVNVYFKIYFQFPRKFINLSHRASEGKASDSINPEIFSLPLFLLLAIILHSDITSP